MEVHDLHLAEPFDVHCVEDLLTPQEKRIRLQGSDSDECDLSNPFSPADVVLPAPFDDKFSSKSSTPSSPTSLSSAHSSCSFLASPFSDQRMFEDIEEIGDPTPRSSDTKSSKVFPGSPLSVVQVVAILMSWFSSFPGISKQSFSRFLFLLHTFILPEGNLLPAGYRAAVSCVNSYILPAEDYHCCVNDCVVYRNSVSGQYKDLTVCPHCGEDRYQSGTHTPRKRFKYIPLAPRLRRMFRNRYSSELLQCHAQKTCDASAQSALSTIHDSPAWKEWYGSEGHFSGEPRAVSLSLCMDGVNPFSKERTSNSMWPMVLTLLNLPHQLRIAAGSMLMVVIILGRNEPKTTDPYLDVLVDEILEINGTVMYDGFRKEKFNLQVDILLHHFDYPGQNKVFHCQGAGAYSGCCYCTHSGEYSRKLNKMVYLGHRRFLPLTDTLHDDKQNFPNRTEPNKQPPLMKTMEFIDSANTGFITSAKPQQLAKETGCKGTYSLRRLPGHERVLNTPVDPMYLIKNVAEHIVRLISGAEDSVKVRDEENFRAHGLTIDIANLCHRHHFD